MPLSDREQQILQDIERRLYEQDPEFAREVGATTLESERTRPIRHGIILLVLGVFVLFAGFILPKLLIPLGVLAFLLMVAGGTLTYQALKKAGAKQLQAFNKQASLRDVATRIEGRLRDMKRRGRDR